MKPEKVTFKISRFRPETSDLPHFQIFEVNVTKAMTVLDCLEQIRMHQDATLMYRRSCHHASCGTCACRINGTEMLACSTRVWDLKTHQVTIEPLANFDVIGDLSVDMNSFFNSMSKNWPHVRVSGSGQSIPQDNAVDSLERFENCIECGACYSSCPVVRENASFLGPAVLAAIHNEYIHTKQKETLNLAGGGFGERLCERAINCSRVCPAGVYPARRILDIRQALEERSAEKH
jgi:succinate dehydrogenase / fumarate reductase iron-sulfur subunit